MSSRIGFLDASYDPGYNSHRISKELKEDNSIQIKKIQIIQNMEKKCHFLLKLRLSIQV